MPSPNLSALRSAARQLTLILDTPSSDDPTVWKFKVGVLCAEIGEYVGMRKPESPRRPRSSKPA